MLPSPGIKGPIHVIFKGLVRFDLSFRFFNIIGNMLLNTNKKSILMTNDHHALTLYLISHSLLHPVDLFGLDISKLI